MRGIEKSGDAIKINLTICRVRSEWKSHLKRNQMSSMSASSERLSKGGRQKSDVGLGKSK